MAAPDLIYRPKVGELLVVLGNDLSDGTETFYGIGTDYCLILKGGRTDEIFCARFLDPKS